MEDQTSIKQMIQSMSPDGAGVVEGTVTNAAPLEITLTNDAKMILSANSLIVPEHLTDHEIEADIMMDDGALYAPTGAEDEKGEHEHPGIAKSGKHAHELKGFQLTGGKIILHTGLKAGEIVYLLSYNNGKKYYVLDRRGVMHMALDIPIPFETIENEQEKTSRTYRIDWDEGRIIGFVDGQEAMNQYIKKAILTPRFRCLIYSNQYGSEIIDTLMDKEVTREYVEAEISFLVTDTLIHDPRVLRVYNVGIEFKDTYPMQDSCVITFDVDTIYGEIPVKEVI